MKIHLDELLSVWLNSFQITLVDLIKEFLLPGIYVLFVVDHCNAALDDVLQLFHQDDITYNLWRKSTSASKV